MASQNQVQAMTVIIPKIQHAVSCQSPNPRAWRWIAVAMFLAGVGMLIGMWRQQDLARRRESWPTTPGQVVDARVEQRSGEDGKKYSPIIRYAYAIDGARYESALFVSLDPPLKKERRRRTLREIPAGNRSDRALRSGQAG
jgi:hypothetical protein